MRECGRHAFSRRRAGARKRQKHIENIVKIHAAPAFPDENLDEHRCLVLPSLSSLIGVALGGCRATPANPHAGQDENCCASVRGRARQSHKTAPSCGEPPPQNTTDPKEPTARRCFKHAQNTTGRSKPSGGERGRATKHHRPERTDRTVMF